MKHYKLIFIALLLLGLCVSGVSALTINDYNASLVTLLHANYTPANPTYFNDSSLNNHIFTNYGTVAHNLTSKQLGNASGWLNGGYLNTSSTSDYNFTGDFTISMWIQRTRTGVEEHFIQKSPNGANYNIRGDFESDDTLMFIFTDTATNNYYLTGSGKISDYNWHQVGVTRSGNNLYSIKDGIQSSATAISNPIIYGTDPLFIGTDKSLSYPSKINFDEVAFWNGISIPNSTLYNPSTELTTPTPPVASFTANATSGAGSIAVLFTDTSTGNMPTSRQYNFTDVAGNNTPVTFATTQNPTHVFGVGNYSISLKATNTTTGSNISSQITFVNVSSGATPNPVFSFFSMFNAAGTAPHTTYLYDQSTNLTGSETFGWDFGEGNTSTGKNVYFTWNFTGEFVVNHSVSNGITTSYSETNVTVGTPTPPVVAPIASFYGGPQTGNVPLTVFFTDVSSNTPTSWFWEFGDGSNSTLQNPNHTYTRSGFRTVNLTATNSAGENKTVRLKFVKVS